MGATPVTRKGHQTRAKILEAAAQVFARDGYVDARMLDIATAAGLSTGGLYRYFDNKTDVLAAVIADIHENFYDVSGHTRPILRTDPLTALMHANRGYIEYYYEHREVMRVFIEAAAIEPRYAEILNDMRNRHVERFTKAFRSIHGQDEVHGVRIEVATEALTCMVEQCCYVWFAQESASPHHPSVDEAVKVTTQAWYSLMFGGG